MLKITSAERLVMAPPNQGWSLERGANHFEENPPDAVAAKLVELIKKNFVKVEVLDLNANSTPWTGDKSAESRDSVVPDPVTSMAEVLSSKSAFPPKK